MTPKELRNLKRLIKSGDGMSAEEAKKINRDEAELYRLKLSKIHGYVRYKAQGCLALHLAYVFVNEDLYFKYKRYYEFYTKLQERLELILDFLF